MKSGFFRKSLSLIFPIGIILFFLIGIVSFFLLCYSGISYMAEDIYDYYRLEDTAVAVNATISRYEEDTDSEGQKEYDLYMTYTYEEKEYSKLHSTIGSENKAKELIGTTSVLEIDPTDPSVVRPDEIFSSALLMLLCVLLVSFFQFYTMMFFAFLFVRRPDYDSNRVLTHDFIADSMRTEANKKTIFRFFVFALTSAAYLYKPFSDYRAEANLYTQTVLICFSGLVGITFIVNCIYSLNQKSLLRNIELAKSSLSEIVSESDSDGNERTVYRYSGFIPQKKRYHFVSERREDDLQAGDKVYIAYITKGAGKRILKIFDRKYYSLSE